MKAIGWIIVGIVVAISFMFSWHWTMDTVNGCVARGGSRAQCFATVKYQNFKRFIGQ